MSNTANDFAAMVFQAKLLYLSKWKLDAQDAEQIVGDNPNFPPGSSTRHAAVSGLLRKRAEWDHDCWATWFVLWVERQVDEHNSMNELKYGNMTAVVRTSFWDMKDRFTRDLVRRILQPFAQDFDVETIMDTTKLVHVIRVAYQSAAQSTVQHVLAQESGSGLTIRQLPEDFNPLV